MGELKAKMTQREFRDWMTFYRAHPFDDMHRFHRPAALVAQSMRGGQIQPLLDWLHPPEWAEDFAQSDINTLRALGIK